MEILQTISVPCIATAVYVIVAVLKYTTDNNEKFKRFLPLISLVLGAICGVVCYHFFPQIEVFDSIAMAIVQGAVSGLTATGFDQIFRQLAKNQT
ncbi:MAG: enolase [Clostridia bacterium]|nr:enolase [Clostridia bacterium]